LAEIINRGSILDDLGELIGAGCGKWHGGRGKWRGRDGGASVVFLERIAGKGAGNGGRYRGVRRES